MTEHSRKWKNWDLRLPLGSFQTNLADCDYGARPRRAGARRVHAAAQPEAAPTPAVRSARNMPCQASGMSLSWSWMNASYREKSLSSEGSPDHTRHRASFHEALLISKIETRTQRRKSPVTIKPTTREFSHWSSVRIFSRLDLLSSFVGGCWMQKAQNLVCGSWRRKHWYGSALY